MIPGAQSNFIILEPDKVQFRHLVERINRLITPSQTSTDVGWLNGRVDFNLDQDLTPQHETCPPCGEVIGPGDAVEICNNCEIHVHTEHPTRDRPCHLPKDEGSTLIFCSETCKSEHAENHKES
jgi:hypothetical protein